MMKRHTFESNHGAELAEFFATLEDRLRVAHDNQLTGLVKDGKQVACVVDEEDSTYDVAHEAIVIILKMLGFPETIDRLRVAADHFKRYEEVHAAVDDMLTRVGKIWSDDDEEVLGADLWFMRDRSGIVTTRDEQSVPKLNEESLALSDENETFFLGDDMFGDIDLLDRKRSFLTEDIFADMWTIKTMDRAQFVTLHGEAAVGFFVDGMDKLVAHMQSLDSSVGARLTAEAIARKQPGQFVVQVDLDNPALYSFWAEKIWDWYFNYMTTEMANPDLFNIDHHKNVVDLLSKELKSLHDRYSEHEARRLVDLLKSQGSLQAGQEINSHTPEMWSTFSNEVIRLMLLACGMVDPSGLLEAKECVGKKYPTKDQ
jgi:uncharacterized protein (DUF1697 family)